MVLDCCHESNKRFLVADYYAEEGYVVLAPDLFWRMEPEVELGYSEEELQKAFGFYQKFDVSKAIEDMQAATNALRQVNSCKGKVGSIGFCLGGKLSYLTAAHCEIDVAVCYYGVGIEEDLELRERITCPLIMHFAELDQFVPEEALFQISIFAFIYLSFKKNKFSFRLAFLHCWPTSALMRWMGDFRRSVFSQSLRLPLEDPMNPVFQSAREQRPDPNKYVHDKACRPGSRQ